MGNNILLTVVPITVIFTCFVIHMYIVISDTLIRRKFFKLISRYDYVLNLVLDHENVDIITKEDLKRVYDISSGASGLNSLKKSDCIKLRIIIDELEQILTPYSEVLVREKRNNRINSIIE